METDALKNDQCALPSVKSLPMRHHRSLPSLLNSERVNWYGASVLDPVGYRTEWRPSVMRFREYTVLATPNPPATVSAPV